MKPTKEFIPSDDYERELLEYENDGNYNPKNILNEEEKARYQKIAEYSVEKREALEAMEEVSKDKDFSVFIQVIEDKGISIQQALKDFVHKIAFEKNYKLIH